MEGIPDTKFQMKEIWKVLGKYDKIEKSPTDVPIWEMWKVPMKYNKKCVFFPPKKSEQYDMLLVSIGHFSSNIGHILVVGRQSRKRNLAHNQHICCKENDTCKGWSFKQSRKDREINGLIYFECGWGGWLHCWKEKIIQWRGHWHGLIKR